MSWHLQVILWKLQISVISGPNSNRTKVNANSHSVYCMPQSVQSSISVLKCYILIYMWVYHYFIKISNFIFNIMYITGKLIRFEIISPWLLILVKQEVFKEFLCIHILFKTVIYRFYIKAYDKKIILHKPIILNTTLYQITDVIKMKTLKFYYNF